MQVGKENYQVLSIDTAEFYLKTGEAMDQRKSIKPSECFRYDRTIQIISHNSRAQKDTYNVIGIMEGEIEPGQMSLPGGTSISCFFL